MGTSILDTRATTGDIGLVMPGHYREQVTLPASGASGNPIVLKAEGAPVVVDGTDDFSSAALWMPAGAHSSRFDGRADDGAPLGAGIYFYRIRSAEGARLGRFVVTR
jgi:hypothetical protein